MYKFFVSILTLVVALAAAPAMAQENDTITWIAPAGTIQTIGNPTYQWQAVDGVETYYIFVSADNERFLPGKFLGIVPASYCEGGVCSVDLTSPEIQNELGVGYAWLNNGNYVAYINPSSNRLGTWFGPFRFTVNTPQPAAFTVTGVSGGNTINWSLAGNGIYSAFFQLYMAPSDALTEPVIPLQWVTREDACGSWDGTTCSYVLQEPLTEGVTYGFYGHGWGAGGFTTGGNIPGLDGWVECKFVPEDGACVEAPTEPTDLAAEKLGEGNVRLTWTAAERATEYVLWVGKIQEDGVETAYFSVPFETAADLGCAEGGTCTFDLPEPLSSGLYSWFLLAKGPGGVPLNNFSGYVAGPAFTILANGG